MSGLVFSAGHQFRDTELHYEPFDGRDCFWQVVFTKPVAFEAIEIATSIRHDSNDSTGNLKWLVDGAVIASVALPQDPNASRLIAEVFTLRQHAKGSTLRFEINLAKSGIIHFNINRIIARI